MKLVLLFAIVMAAGAAAKTVKVDWVEKPYAPIEVAVGDKVKFAWAAGAHDVWSLPSAECDFDTDDGAAELAAADAGTYTWTAAAPGVVRVACSIGDHCSEGQLLEITVKAAAGAGAGAEAAAAGGIPEGVTAADMAKGAAPMPEGAAAADMAKADALQEGTAPDPTKPVNGTAVAAVVAEVEEAAAVASGAARAAGAAFALAAAALLLA